MSPLSKNIQKFLVFFFGATSVMLIVLGVIRVKKTPAAASAPAPSPEAPLTADATGGTTVTGNAFQTPWGSTVASITVKNGKVVSAKMPSVPNSPPSVYAEAYLVDQAVKAGGANIQGVSGATYTSLAFKSSLESAISKAQSQGQTVTANTQTVDTATYAKPSVPRKYHDEEEWEDEEEDDELEDIEDDEISF